MNVFHIPIWFFDFIMLRGLFYIPTGHTFVRSTDVAVLNSQGKPCSLSADAVETVLLGMKISIQHLLKSTNKRIGTIETEKAT